MTAKNAISDTGAFRPEASVFVTANAGAGKTSLLTRRVLSLLLHGVPPSKILCITYTNAASAEMQERVRRELGRWVLADDASLEASLRELLGHAPPEKIKARARSLFASVLDASDELRIQTIHGLCQSLLRRFSLEAGVNPHFGVIDSRTAQELLQEARIRLCTHAQKHDDELKRVLHRLATDMGEMALDSLLTAIIDDKQAFQALFGQINRQRLEASVWKQMGLPQDITIESLISRHFVYDTATLAALRDIARKLSQGEKTDRATAAALAGWLEGESPRRILMGDYIRCFVTDKGTARERIFTKNTLDNETQVEMLRREQQRVVAFSELARAHAIAKRTTDLLHLAEALLSLYEQLKRARAAIDYDDMILISLNLLQRSGMAAWVLFKLDGGIDHVLVDESQDTSPLQWHIIEILTSEFFSGEGRSKDDRSLFIVGDEKQSIYSFQGADLHAMGRMQRYFAEKIQDSGRPLLRRALLHSYRSTPEILQAVDAIFSREPAQKGVAAADALMQHQPIRLDARGVVELWPLAVAAEEDTISSVTLLARQLAQAIRGWLDEGRMLASAGRAIQPGDILILVARRNRFVDALVRALKRQHIPVAGIDRMQLGDNIAVQDLLALAQAALLPEDDLTLACVLKSPIFDMGEDQLFDLAHGRTKGETLWQRLQASENCKEAYQLLAAIRSRADYTLPYEFFAHVLDTLGARARFVGRMGVEYADPIDEFLSQCMGYEQNHVASLQGFLRWFASSKSEVKRDMEQAGERVRIMTVHGAKGLQAPVVILPDTTHTPKLRDHFLWGPFPDSEAGLPFWPGSSARDNELCAKLRQESRQRMLEEHHRLLYVALTRAEDHLYICGAAENEKIGAECWYELIRSGMTPLSTPFETPAGTGLRIGDKPGTLSVPPQDIPARHKPAADFRFLSTPAPQEPLPTKPLTPSALDSQDRVSLSPAKEKSVYERGRFIHALLQYLPQVPDSKLLSMAEAIARPYRHTLTTDVVEKAIAETFAIVNDPRYGFLFGEQALAEVPVVGNVQVSGQTVTVSGQIDRLYIGKNEVWIVDFKTGSQPAEAPRSYVRQLALYRLVVEKIYPDKTVVCALLWTGSSNITVLDEALLAPYI